MIDNKVKKNPTMKGSNYEILNLFLKLRPSLIFSQLIPITSFLLFRRYYKSEGYQTFF